MIVSSVNQLSAGAAVATVGVEETVGDGDGETGGMLYGTKVPPGVPLGGGGWATTEVAPTGPQIGE